jgi:hypothetical protein
MKWAPNPYVLAERLSGKLLAVDEAARADILDAFLREALLSKGKKKTVTEAFAVFQQIAELFERPVSFGRALATARPIYQAAGYTTEQVIPALLDLLPIVGGPSADDSFADAGQLTDAGQLIVQKAMYLDPVQGAIEDCYLISAMIALAWAVPQQLAARLTAAGFAPPADRSFQWPFHDHRGGQRQAKVSGRLMTRDGGLRYARSRSPQESWPALVEKAYVMNARASGTADELTALDYKAINRGSTPARACQSLMGGRVRGEILDSLRGVEIFLPGGRLSTPHGVMSKPVMAWTKEDIGVKEKKVWEKTGLWPNHAYAVLGVMDSGHIVLRNPHGRATERRRGYAEGPWQIRSSSVQLNVDGVFALSRDLFYAHFNDISWVDLD